MPEFLVIKDLVKTYYLDKKPVPVLKGITLTINRGDMISILGVSGVGKSTFLQVLGTLDRPTSGKVYFRGKDIFRQSDMDLASFRNHTIGFVYQFHHLLAEFTGLENVMLPMLIHGEKLKRASVRATCLLDEVGLSHRLHHKPGQLSGGEQQRVALARSLVMNPEIVLADEPTGNLDRQTARNIEDLMLDLNKRRNITFILATHNEELAGRLHKQLRLNNGIF